MNQQIVNLRGIAILMVILGHSIIIYDSTFDLLSTNVAMPLFETLKHWISFAQMKLFISISGFLLAYKCLNTGKLGAIGGDFIKGKALRLLVPYICVLLLYNDPIKYILGIPGYEAPASFIQDQLLGVNCAHLWYLPCLFLLMLVGYPLFSWAGRSPWRHAALFAVFLAINFFSGRLPEYYQLNTAGYYLIFFHLGYLVNWSRQIYATQLKAVKWHIAIPIIIAVIAIGYVVRMATSIGYEVYLSICVILLFYVAIPSFKVSFINEISKRSYGLYLFHSPLIYLTAHYCPDINPWLMLLVNFVGFGGVAYMLTALLSKTKLKFIIGA